MKDSFIQWNQYIKGLYSPNTRAMVVRAERQLVMEKSAVDLVLIYHFKLSTELVVLLFPLPTSASEAIQSQGFLCSFVACLLSLAPTLLNEL